jgi:hypothetical protein
VVAPTPAPSASAPAAPTPTDRSPSPSAPPSAVGPGPAAGSGPPGPAASPGAGPLVISTRRTDHDGRGAEVVTGLNATVQTALLDVGLIGWTVPAVALGVPGILVIVVVALQLLGGAAWLPIARRALSRSGSPDTRSGPPR